MLRRRGAATTIGLLLGCLTLLPALGVAQVPPTTAPATTPAPARVDVAARLAAAEQAYADRKNPAQLQEAIKAWQEVLQAQPDHAEAAWKLSRAAVWWGDHSPKSKKEAIHKKGVDWGKQAIKLAPASAEAMYWTAANMGSYGRAHGIRASLSMIDPMRQLCEKILRGTPSYWRAHMLLGMLYREAPGWPISIGDGKRALQELEKAVSLAPQVPRALYELGVGYAEEGEDDKARELLRRAIAAPLEPGFELESAETRIQAKAKLADLD